MEADLARYGVAIRRRLGFPTPGYDTPIALEPPAMVTPPPRDEFEDIDEDPSDAELAAADSARRPTTAFTEFTEPSETPADAIAPIAPSPVSANDTAVAPAPESEPTDAERQSTSER
jgi:hypothetical protein